MYLESLKITRFRSFLDSTVRFTPEFDGVVLGENNGGKSNIIDAIRLANSTPKWTPRTIRRR